MQNQTIPAEAAALRAKARDPHIDVLKGLGMLLVIITHMVHAQDFLGYSAIAYCMTFQMPLFFFVTGYLYAGSSDVGMPFGRYALKKARTLLVPYVAFYAVSFLWMNTVYAQLTGGTAFHFSWTWTELLASLALAGKPLFDFALIPFPIWFLHAMFFASLIFYFIMKLKKPLWLALVALALALATVPVKRALESNPVWLLRLLPPALFYMIVGHLFRQLAADRLLPRMRKGLVFSLFVPAACMVVGLLLMREARGDLWEIDSYLYFVGSLASIFGCFSLAQNLDSTALGFVGKNSLMYLGLQALILELPVVVSLPAWFQSQGFDGLVPFIGYFCVSLALITLLVLVPLGVKRWYRHLIQERDAHKDEL